MEEESAARGGIEGVGKLPSAAPAFFVILTPSQGDGSKEEGILVANRDVSSVAPVITTGSDQSKSDFFLSSNCTSGEITVTLDNNNMWNEFYRCNTEMVLTKQGRRMFPYCRYWISGLNPYLKYILVMDITPLDNQRYKWNGKWWEPAGKADPHVLGRVFIHPESPSTGQYWMHQPVSFYKLKLTNNILDQEGHIILHSMHRYLPRLHVVPAEKSPEVIQLNGPDVHTFTFPQTEFIAVTAYQNFQITQLKIDCNPFAKGFREGTVPGRPVKDLKHKPSEQEVDASSSKNLEENEDPDRMKKLQELFKMSEYLDGDKENDIFNSVREFLKLTQSTPVLDKDTKPDEDVLKRFAEHSSVASLSTPSEQLSVEVKKEPEDDYDYSKTSASAIESVAVKQEQSDTEDADVDYPILEKHFAKFKEDPYLDGNHSSDSPTGVAKAKLLELDQGSMCLEPCAADNHLEAPDLPKPVLPEDTLQDMDAQDSTLRTESPPICPSPSVNSQVGVDVSVKEKRKRICKNKIDEIYATLQTALRTSRGPKRKCPLLFPKPPVTPTPGNEGTVTPIAKKRGRPPKPKISKVGRPAKKDNPIEAPRLFPDFNPDLEDVDGVLFVAFSSKEALDVHMENKPPDTEPSSLSTPEANSELTDEMQKILRLERQLLTHLKTMKNRQVIHPALQQVGIKLNIVDPAMSIDLRYLGVELTLLSITSDANYDDNGLCAQGWPFVSRTGKTTDYTKIKGWRDKFSTEPATSSHKNEAGRKNLSAFCSDELDEYLENEAKLMGDLKELTWHKPESSVSYQLPTKSSSYVRTLDSVLKKQAQQAKSSLNTAEQFPVPRKKRKYTRRVFTPKPDSKARPIIPASITVKEKSAKPHSVQKKDHSASHFLNKVPSTPSSSVECLSESQPVLKPSEDEQNGTVQPNLVASGEGNVFLNLQTQQASKPIGFSKVQMKLLELEECAMWEGKPRTYITKERADLSLSTLLTAQASLRNKPIQKLINKRTDLCNKDFCRLGCICSSLSLTKHTDTHCQHETCMFSCDCLKNKHSGKDGLKDETTQNKSETAFSLVPGCGYQPVQAEKTVKSPEARQTEEQQEMTVDGSGKAKKRKFTEGNDRKSDVRTPVPFPIWNRSDVADDPEPLCIPEQAEFVGPKILHKEHTVKGKSPGGGGKVGRPSSVAHIHPEDPMYLYSNSMKTCARVRAYQRKAPEEKKMKDQSICGSDTPGKEHNLKSSKTRAQEKDANKEDEIVEKKCDTMNNNGPSKLIDIISDCSREEDDSKVLNITSQRMTRKEPQSFKVGSFNVELKQENGIGEKSASGTFCSRVKIAVSAEKQVNSDTPNPRPVNAENAKPSEEPEDKPADIEAKSHGGKGLPFYAKVIPAGKLVAHLKTSDVNQAQLVEVNGKNHTQAKLLLGQMGALHPANRLAAYVTRRLQPNLSHLSKVNEVSAKMATKSLSSNVITEDKSKDILPSQQNKTAAQSRPSSTLTQFVMGDDGSVQKSPGVSSSEPTILGSPKLSIQSTRLIFVSSTVAAGKQAPALTTTSSSSMNLPSLSTIPLSSAGLSADLPPRKKATPSLPTLMRVTKLITKGSSLSIPAGIVAATDARAMTLTSVPSTKDTVLTPPVLSSPLVKSSPTTGNRSSVSPSNNPGINKSIATSLPSLVLSPNVPRVGSVASQVGLNITSPVTVKTVSNSPVPALNPSKVTSGPGKRLGPRLLLIPVNSSSSPSRPVQRVQSSPGQKMVLQPIKTTCGVTLFRHPNGQIVQLVPLQVQSSNVQPSRQQVIIRNPGPVMGARFPLLTKSEASASTSVSIPGTTVPPASPSSNLPVLSPSKTSPNKSGTAIFPQNPPMLSQLGSLVVKASPPKRNCEASLPFPKVVTYTASEHAVITSKVMPLLSAGLSLPNIPPPPLQNNSPANASTKPNLTLMGNKPGTTSTPNEEDKKLSDSLSPLKYGLSGEKSDKEVVKECEGQPTSEIVNDGNGPEVQKSTNQQNKSVTEEVDTIAKEEQCQNGQQDNGQLSIDSINELFASNVDLQEPRKKDSQDVLMRRNQGPADNGESQQCIADNTNSQEKIGDSSPVTLASAEHVAAGVEQNTLCKTGEKAELSMEQKSAKSQDSVSSSDQNNCESLQVDPQAKKVSKWIDSKETISDDQEIQSNLQSEEESDIDSDSVDIETVEELSDMIAGAKAYAAVVLKCTPGKVCENDSKSEVDEYVDIETLEALSEKINVTYRKESAHLNKDMCDTEGKSSKEQKKGSKMTGEDIFSEALDEGTNIFHRKNHTANERKRRSELRDLFEELRNALGLHNLPKVSKGFILKQAIEEIKDLTDTADTLIKKKTLLSQTQAQLIKKVSNLSGKSREVVLKKLENLYAKQKAVETEQQKKNLEEDVALDIAPMILPPPKQEPFFPLKLQEETNETLSGKTKKPIILTRKALFHPKEGNQLQPGVPLTTSNVLMAPTGQVGKQEHGVAGQVAGIPSTLIQADLSPVQIQSDEDDLTMMPKIVNVMSLALEAKSDMGMEIGISGTEKEWKSDACSLTTEAYARGNAPAQDACYVTAKSCVPSTSVPVDKKKEEVADPARKSCSPYSSLHENLPQENYSGNTEASLKTKDVSVSITPPTETVDDTRGSKLDLELKKLTSAIDEAGLDPTELPDTMGDPEEADETLTSLLDEIAFLNQQINSDADALESVSDFPGPDTVSHSDVSKFADSAPFSFGRFKDGPETKDNISFSPLFMQLEEGEILDNSKLNEGASLGVFAGGARKEPHLTEAAGTSIGLRQPPATVPTYQRTDQSMGSCSDVFWRPMPKLAPLGLKSCTLPSDQRVLASKPMPSLASVAMKLSSPESTD
ncbi:MAX gene-associated protein isoform X3 [Bufo gargarizans]|uniref:MAX gene-associated protein isoform X3 n=1 Tax=Bufo gargarizans TaxID=30331 RepID=UPI001CF3E23D|nr:MAX gene-associated protein isoform X3 [Bufo gargarizans]